MDRIIEVTRTSSEKTLKFTLSKDGDLRIKVYNGIEPSLEREWIDRCKEIAKYFWENPYENTLRASTFSAEEELTLRIGAKKKSIFRVKDTVPVKITEEGKL